MCSNARFRTLWACEGTMSGSRKRLSWMRAYQEEHDVLDAGYAQLERCRVELREAVEGRSTLLGAKNMMIDSSENRAEKRKG